jgi:hypothetical protein
MNRTTLAAALLLAGAALTTLPAKADIIGGLDFDTSGATILTLGGVPSGNQVQNVPCIICGANQPNQTNLALGFGYTDFGNTGNQTNVAYFSSGILRDTALGADTISGTNYSLAQLTNLLLALGDPTLTFSIGIDVNDTGTAQTLESFYFIDLTTQTILAAFSPQPGGTLVPSLNNGTGFPDYTLDGLSLAGLNPNDQYAFFARISGANDGPDSFFIVPNVAAVPGPIVGAGIPGIVAACGGMFGLNFWRRRRNGNSVPA